jgi:poly(A) polymerase
LFEQDVALGRDAVTPEYAEAIRKIRSFTPEEIRPQPLVTGDDLIAMGLKPGPLFTKLLGAVEEGQLNGTLFNSAAAKELAFVMAQIEKGLNVS